MGEQPRAFERLTLVERLFNSAVGGLVRLGIGPADMRVLEVRGRKSGKRYAVPVDLLPHDDKLYLVAPRGRTQWVRNAAASGSVVLRRGRQCQTYRLRALPDAEKAPILQRYLDRFRSQVQRFFPVAASAPAEAFTPLAPRYPVFELTPEP